MGGKVALHPWSGSGYEVKLQTNTEAVTLSSGGERIAARLVLPSHAARWPALIVCHGMGEFKEHYSELCDFLADRGIGTLALDMHGHGESGGERFHVNIRDWVADVRAAVEFLAAHPSVDGDRIGAFGLSSGGTAILEAALLERRLKVLVTMSATVRNPLSWVERGAFAGLTAIGQLKRVLTGKDWRISAHWLIPGMALAADPQINTRLLADPRIREALTSFPLPGAAASISVDTLRRVSEITVPTLVLWGELDMLDPVRSAHLLYGALTCPKRLCIVLGNGHAGHLDRNRAQVFALTADWTLEHLAPPRATAVSPRASAPRGCPTVIEGEAARNLDQAAKWALLSPFLRQNGRSALAYSTLQHGLEYFIDECGYIAYTTVRHPVLARKSLRIALTEPICAEADYGRLVTRFLARNRSAMFCVIPERCAEVLREMGFKACCVGYESELPIQTYDTKGNWKELDLIRRARNEAHREGIVIQEESAENLRKQDLEALSARWIKSKKISDREIWFFARRPVFEREADVRKFAAYDREGQVVGFAFYDPMYRDGRVVGYAAIVVRCDEQRFNKLIPAIHMTAIERFRPEGAEVLNLALAPFVELDQARFNDDRISRMFFQLSERYGNSIYNFRGLSFHKSKYRGQKKYLYYASNRGVPSVDIYLAFRAADITQSYFATVGRLLWGMAEELTRRRRKDPS